MIRLTANGKDITNAISGRVLSCTLTDRRADQVDEFTIELDNHDDQLAAPDPGATLQVWLQDNDQSWVAMGTFEVDAIGITLVPMTISIRATSGDITSSLKANRDYSYDNTTLGAVLDTIAKRNDLSTAISPELASQTIDHLDQTTESDLSLISRLGELFDAVATVKNNQILFNPIGAGTAPSGTVLPTVTIPLTDCTSAHLERQKTPYTGVAASWNNRAYARRDTIVVGSDNNPFTIRTTFRTEALAKTAATSKWAKLKRAEQTLELELKHLNLAAIAEAGLTVKNAPAGINADGWLINEVEHRLGGDGFRTRVSAELIN